MRQQVTVGFRSFGIGKRATQASVLQWKKVEQFAAKKLLNSKLGSKPRISFDEKLLNSSKGELVLLTKVS